MEAVWHLHKYDCLSKLSEAERAEIRAAAAVRRYARGEVVFAPDPVPESVYLLEQGLVRIYRLSKEGAEATLGFVGDGEVFGELSALDHLARESYAEAARPSVVWRIPRLQFKRLVSKIEALSHCVSVRTGTRLKKIETRLEDLIFRSVRERIARVLLELSEDFGRPDPKGSGFLLDVPLTQTQIGSLVGASRQSVNRALGELEAEGLIGRSGRRLAIRRPEELRRLVEG